MTKNGKKNSTLLGNASSRSSLQCLRREDVDDGVGRAGLEAWRNRVGRGCSRIVGGIVVATAEVREVWLGWIDHCDVIKLPAPANTPCLVMKRKLKIILVTSLSDRIGTKYSVTRIQNSVERN